jgi:RNA polymerase sigma-70 factor (ECF subfamily)
LGALVSKRESDWASLMRAANAGDAGAYDRLLRQLAPVLRAGARRGLVRAGLGPADAEDVVQETLLAVHLKRQTWDEGLPIGPWINAIARNKLIDFLRRRRMRAHVPIDDLAEVLPAQDAEPSAVAHDIDRHVGALPERQREVVRRIAVDGASIGEAARALDMNEGAVRVALHRGLNRLATKFRAQ